MGVRVFIFAFCLALLCASGVLAPSVYASEFEVFASNNPPFNYQTEDGEVRGIAVDILKMVMERSYQPLDPGSISVINWARAVETTSTQPGKVLLSPARTFSRECMFEWLGPLHPFTLGLIARKESNIRINAPEDIHKYRIGVIRDSAPVQILTKQLGVPKANLVELANDEQLFLMLERGRVDLIPRGRMSASFWLERLELYPDDFEMVHVFKELDLYIALSPMTDPMLVHRLNLELMRIKQDRPDGSNEFDEIVRRHVHGMPVALK